MGTFNLEGKSNVMEGAVILGIPYERFGFLANPYLMSRNNCAPYLSNRDVVMMVLTHAYDNNGNPVRRTNSKRMFRTDDFSEWSSYRDAGKTKMSIEGFNFPCELDHNFKSASGLSARLRDTHGKGIAKKLAGELEGRIYLPDPFRYGCTGKGILYHEEDAMRVIEELFAEETKSDVRGYSIREIGDFLCPGEGDRLRSRIPRLLERLREQGIEIEVDHSSSIRKFMLDPKMIKSIIRENNQFHPKKKMSLDYVFVDKKKRRVTG